MKSCRIPTCLFSIHRCIWEPWLGDSGPFLYPFDWDLEGTYRLVYIYTHIHMYVYSYVVSRNENIFGLRQMCWASLAWFRLLWNRCVGLDLHLTWSYKKDIQLFLYPYLGLLGHIYSYDVIWFQIYHMRSSDFMRRAVISYDVIRSHMITYRMVRQDRWRSRQLTSELRYQF